MPAAELEATLEAWEDFAEADRIDTVVVPFAREPAEVGIIRLDGIVATEDGRIEILTLRLESNTDADADRLREDKIVALFGGLVEIPAEGEIRLDFSFDGIADGRDTVKEDLNSDTDDTAWLEGRTLDRTEADERGIEAIELTADLDKLLTVEAPTVEEILEGAGLSETVAALEDWDLTL